MGNKQMETKRKITYNSSFEIQTFNLNQRFRHYFRPSAGTTIKRSGEMRGLKLCNKNVLIKMDLIFYKYLYQTVLK